MMLIGIYTSGLIKGTLATVRDIMKAVNSVNNQENLPSQNWLITCGS